MAIYLFIAILFILSTTNVMLVIFEILLVLYIMNKEYKIKLVNKNNKDVSFRIVWNDIKKIFNFNHIRTSKDGKTNSSDHCINYEETNDSMDEKSK